MASIGINLVDHVSGAKIFGYYFNMASYDIAPDKDWKQLGIYPPLFGLIGYFKF